MLATGALDRSSLPAGEEWHVGGSADFDGDGADDLMLFSRVKGEVEVWTFTGAAVATRTRLAGHVGAWSVVAVDDTDGDGMAEIVWLDELARDARAARPRPPRRRSRSAALASGWRGRGGVDLAGDGSAELVVQQHRDRCGAGPGRSTTTASSARSNLPSARVSALRGRRRLRRRWPRGPRVERCLRPRRHALARRRRVRRTPLVVDRALPAGGEVVSGATASDDSAFRQRFCSGDLDGNGHRERRGLQALPDSA